MGSIARRRQKGHKEVADWREEASGELPDENQEWR